MSVVILVSVDVPVNLITALTWSDGISINILSDLPFVSGFSNSIPYTLSKLFVFLPMFLVLHWISESSDVAGVSPRPSKSPDAA